MHPLAIFTLSLLTIAPLSTVAPLEAVNTADQPDGVRAKTRQWRHDMTGRETRYSFPARSFTVLRFD